jgi:phosphoribosylformylglycinamidine cyclo-ligase
MFNTYNMGVGMCVTVPAEQADKALEILNGMGEDAYVIGNIIKGEDKIILK